MDSGPGLTSPITPTMTPPLLPKEEEEKYKSISLTPTKNSISTSTMTKKVYKRREQWRP